MRHIIFASVVKKTIRNPRKRRMRCLKSALSCRDKGDTAKAKAVYQQVVSKFHGTDGAKQAQKNVLTPTG